jgi:flagellar biogenesis protein FliO
MLNWISETILSAVNSVPGVFTTEGTPTFMLVRAMIALLLITFVVWLLAMRLSGGNTTPNRKP